MITPVCFAEMTERIFAPVRDRGRPTIMAGIGEYDTMTIAGAGDRQTPATPIIGFFVRRQALGTPLLTASQAGPMKNP